MSACPNCGAIEFVGLSDHYDEEVRKADPDLDLLTRIAPPTRRASIHGFIMGVWFWILMLAPFFAPEGKMVRTCIPIAIAALAWVPIFIFARTISRARASVSASRYCRTIV